MVSVDTLNALIAFQEWNVFGWHPLFYWHLTYAAVVVYILAIVWNSIDQELYALDCEEWQSSSWLTSGSRTEKGYTCAAVMDNATKSLELSNLALLGGIIIM